jgi:hypothetical protein
MNTPKRSLKELAQESLSIQNACNMVGLSLAFRNMLLDLSHHLHDGNLVNHHPIVILWLDKFSSLAGIQVLTDPPHNAAISHAYAQVTEMACKED